MQINQRNLERNAETQLLDIFYLINSYIKKVGYKSAFNTLGIVLLKTFQHPITMFYVIRAIAQFKYSKKTILGNFKKSIFNAYSLKLTLEDRVRALIFHNDFVMSKLSKKFFECPNYECKLWALNNSDDLEIFLSNTNEQFTHEGLLSLTLRLNGCPMFFFSFLICSGALFNISGPVFFLTRIQGVPNQYDSIKLINKMMGNLNLSNMLLSAAEGFSLSLGIRTIVSTGASNQLSFNPDYSKNHFYSTYDEFLYKNGALINHDGYFLLSVPLPIKELSMVQAHRSRHKRHCAIRSDISEAAQEAVQYSILKS